MPALKQIVVGVDGSECSRDALRWAAEEARQHGAQLVVVTTWTALPPPIAYPYGELAPTSDEPPAEAASRALDTFLEDALDQDRPGDTRTHAPRRISSRGSGQALRQCRAGGGRRPCDRAASQAGCLAR